MLRYRAQFVLGFRVQSVFEVRVKSCYDLGLSSFDSVLYASNDSIQVSLNQDLENISLWLTANKLTLNMDKTEFMSISSNQRLNNLSTMPVLRG